MLKVGITGGGFIRWGGGFDFLRSVASSLKATSVPMELHLLAPGQGTHSSLQRIDQQFRNTVKGVLGRKITPTYEPTRADLLRAIESFGVPIHIHHIDDGIKALQRQAKYLSLDVLLPSFSPLPFGRELPWVGYIYDFQHRHLPGFFAEKERMQRDRQFSAMLTQSPAVIVNSKSVELDISNFYADLRTPIFSLPFSAAPSESWLSMEASHVSKRISIKSRYFIICNQFWLHKDHATAFEAFANLANDPEYSDIDLVCTGHTSDHRGVGYFEKLMEQLRATNTQSRVHILGMIPKNDQISLMKGAIALLQPTLCEGGPGGGAVYDAVSLGVPSIVSDIPVNLEIADEELITFFRARDAVSLAQSMCFLLASEKLVRPSIAQLIEQGQRRRRRCGEVLIDAIDYVRHLS